MSLEELIEEIASPRPVPPYFRVVETSAWVNASKILDCLLGLEGPCPVSVTSKRITAPPFSIEPLKSLRAL